MTSALKFLNSKRDDNVVVEITMTAEDGNTYQCVGVLISEKDGMLRIAFNAKEDKVFDFIDIETKYIINIFEIKEQNINFL